jgi:hypothetical protein
MGTKLINMKYGDLPTVICPIDVDCKEMMFYQYLPIKLIGESNILYENRLLVFHPIIQKIVENYLNEFGILELMNSYIYLTVKHQYQVPHTSFNRLGYHSDGFLTDDINYIWSDKFPTVFNTSDFNLTLDDKISLGEMEQQALKENEVRYPDSTILRLNQFNIHRVGENTTGGMRTFVKVSFSKDKYDLVGNSHNYELDYDWEMKERVEDRNIPQTKINCDGKE